MRRLSNLVLASAALVASAASQARAQRAGTTADATFSPDSSYVARVYLPPVTDSATLVREYRVDVRPRSAAFAPTGDYRFAMRGRAAPALEWSGPFTLRVTYAPSAQLLRERDRYGPVALDYRPSHVEFPRTGLWDAHAHVSWYGEAALDSLTAYGIVAVRDCGGDPIQVRRWRDEIATGQRRGPRIYFSGPAIDGPKNARYRLVVRTPEEGRRAVDSLAALGVSFIKTHNALSRATYFAILREARRRGLMVASHLPRGVPAWEAADSGAASLEHAAESLLTSPIYAGYASDLAGAVAWWRSPAGDSAIGQLRRTGVAVTPTLVAYRAFAASAASAEDSTGRYEVLAFLEDLTGRLYRAGIPIMAGSDFAGPESPLVPGRSLRDELDLLVDAGLTPQAAVASATRVPAAWMNDRVAVAPLIGAAQTPADSAAALTGVREFATACRRDAGHIWGRSLCGPLITVDGATGLAVATEQPPQGTFNRRGALWIGRVPDGMQVANTAFEWNGRLWSTIRLPLPTDQYARIRLLIHEAFHRIQPDLGLNARDAINAHLDERDGRYLLRLELRATAAAVQSSGPAARRATYDALLFRAQRNRLYPGSDSLETSLEIQEGLAEYTGTRSALAATGLGAARVAEATAEFENRPTYVRALGYGTGPLLGFLLDRYAPRWRTRIHDAGFSRQLAPAVGFVAPADLAGAVAASAARYGGDSLARAEDERAVARARAVAEFRSLLVDGPVIILQADQMFRSFNPNNLVPLGTSGTVYPTGAFQAAWGVLTVEHGGALVAPGNREVRVPVPSAIDSTAAVIEGRGWRLELRPGWRLRPGPRPGDFTATP